MLLHRYRKEYIERQAFGKVTKIEGGSRGLDEPRCSPNVLGTVRVYEPKRSLLGMIAFSVLVARCTRVHVIHHCHRVLPIGMKLWVGKFWQLNDLSLKCIDFSGFHHSGSTCANFSVTHSKFEGREE